MTTTALPTRMMMLPTTRTTRTTTITATTITHNSSIQRHRRRTRSGNGMFLVLFLVLLLLMAATSTEASTDDNEETNTTTTTKSKTIIGIDLGTTYSCVGVYRHGNVEIIPNEQGNRITPSSVAFLDQEDPNSSTHRILVGDAAKNQATLNPRNTIFDVKRLIGRKYHDRSVQQDQQYLPYDIVKGDDDDRPYVVIQQSSNINTDTHKKMVYAPEELSALVLAKLKLDAERYLGTAINRAVVTVPAYFTDAQRHATRDAGIIAGLSIERILNEPTAAAIAYGMERKQQHKANQDADDDDDEQHILVYDLGGGTFDVTVLTIDGGIFEVLATNGDTHLGGSDFDHAVMQYYLDSIRHEQKTTVQDVDDVAHNPRALQKLRTEVERAKRALSRQVSVRLEIDDLVPGYDFRRTLTRAKFEAVNEALFQRTLGPVTRVLDDAGLDKEEIAEIILVGGSTRIPKIHDLLTEYFQGKALNTGINPDEAVAYGAAVQGSILSGEGGEEVQDVMLLDVAPLSLGTETDGGIMTVLIPRGTTIPTERSMEFHTLEDNQRRMTIDVFEGERSLTADNRLLGLFEMTNLPPAPRGTVNVRVTFSVDQNGLLAVTAVNVATKDTKTIQITPDDGRLSEDDIAQMVHEAEQYAEQDQREVDRIEARNGLESFLYQLTTTFEEHAGEEDEEDDADSDRNMALESLREALDWLESHHDAPEGDFQEWYSRIDSITKSVVSDLLKKNSKNEKQDASLDDEL